MTFHIFSSTSLEIRRVRKNPEYVRNNWTSLTGIVLNVWGRSGAHVCKTCSAWKVMRSVHYLQESASINPRKSLPKFSSKLKKPLNWEILWCEGPEAADRYDQCRGQSGAKSFERDSQDPARLGRDHHRRFREGQERRGQGRLPFWLSLLALCLCLLPSDGKRSHSLRRTQRASQFSLETSRIFVNSQ